MRNARILKLFAVLTVLLALVGCFASAGGAQQAAAVQNIIAQRETGVNSANQQSYLSTVLPSDKVLVKEETNLIRAAGSLGIKDYQITATSLKSSGDGGYTARLQQSYTIGSEQHNISYSAVFKSENGKLYYDGPVFSVKQNEQVKVYFTGKYDSLAQQLLSEETSVLASMKDQLGFVPQGFISVKLFDDQQVFLQSVKLDLPAWVGGWHEYGESIKSFTGAYGDDGSAYKSVLNHETTHRMVSELSNDNASYWIQEGLAGVFQTALDEPDGALLTADEAGADYTPYTQQKTIDLEKLGMNNQGAVMLYYSTSKAFAAFLLDQYGWQKVKQMLEYMKRFDEIPVTGAEKIDKTNSRTDEALKNILGIDSDEIFQADFDKWQESKK
jgi:hypothetical protein